MGKAIRVMAATGAFMLAMGLFACSGGTTAGSSAASRSESVSSSSASLAPSESASSASASSGIVEPIDDNTTDQMYRDSLEQAKLYVYVKDGKALTVDHGYGIDLHSAQNLKEGSYYEVVADVDILNGGIAGYVNYPEVKRVYSCTEIAREDVPIP